MTGGVSSKIYSGLPILAPRFVPGNKFWLQGLDTSKNVESENIGVNFTGRISSPQDSFAAENFEKKKIKVNCLRNGGGGLLYSNFSLLYCLEPC